ncbi:MAG: alcohol dehydrogenase catalytic domain-containing protein [Tetragenococcus halophilus]|nr:alcohol dehydrogenase catalytic domain-containing protein [Tetragenococcus halophilus]
MKAAYIQKNGEADQIKFGDLKTPQIDAHEVLVKVQAVSVNHVDTFVRSGGFKTKLSFPFVIGRDAVGTVVEIGSKTRNFAVGQRVWTHSMGYEGRQGTSAEFIAVPESRLFLVPEHVNPLELVASVHSSATADILLHSVLKIKQKQNILIEGAGGHVGSKLVTLASASGLDISTTSNLSDFAYLKKLGAKQTYNYQDPVNRINDQFDYIIDTSGKVSLQDNLDLLGLNGQIVLITSPNDNQFNFRVKSFYMARQSIKGFVISHATLEELQSSAHHLNYFFNQGQLSNKQ